MKNKQPLAKVRKSSIHGRGMFAVRRIKPGQRIIGYEGERLTEEEVEKRYNGDELENPHTFLFWVRDNRYVDASVGGNDARFINHSCDPNCQTIIEDDQIFIEAIKNIQPGVELTYDYSLEIEEGASARRKRLYACGCGAGDCRGTMLDA